MQKIEMFTTTQPSKNVYHDTTVKKCLHDTTVKKCLHDTIVKRCLPHSSYGINYAIFMWLSGYISAKGNWLEKRRRDVR